MFDHSLVFLLTTVTVTYQLVLYQYTFFVYISKSLSKIGVEEKGN